MSIDKKAFGISDSLIQAVNEALKGNQHKIDVAEPKGKITGADFKKLRGEELIGGQKKLDKNHNGKLDKQDFKMLRKEEVVDEGNPANKAKKNAAAAAVGAQNRDAHHNAKRGMRTDVADKIRGREVMQGQPRVRHEEVEQMDELSRKTLISYGVKADSQLHKVNALGMGTKVSGIPGHYRGKNKELGKDPAHKVRARKAGSELAWSKASKMKREEVEQVDELSTDTYHRAAHKAAKRAMGDVQGRSGPIFKKYAGMANKFRDKGMSQEKKEKAMKEETVSEVSDAAKKVLGAVAKKHGGKVPFTSTTYKDGKKVVTRGHNDEKGNRVVTSTTNEETDPGFVAEADNAVAKQIAAKKDAFKKQLQQKIAAKQMNTMQAKANKRLANIHASNSKCTCQEGKKSMSCEVCNGDKGMKGGKEQIIVNPPMREAAELPKKVITKGHEIAKSIIKHKGKVDNPYAVGMAAAKKSAGIKEDAEQVDEVLDSPIKKMAYIMKAKKSIEKSDPKKIKQANDIANRVIGIKRVMNKVNKKD